MLPAGLEPVERYRRVRAQGRYDFFIGRDGTIHEVVIGGPMAEALLRTRIEEILK